MRAMLWRCTRIRTSVSTTWLVTSSEVVEDASRSATFSRASMVSVNSADGTRSTSRAVRTSPSSSVRVSESVTWPPTRSTTFCTSKRASPTSSARRLTVPVEMIAASRPPSAPSSVAASATSAAAMSPSPMDAEVESMAPPATSST